MNIIVLIVDVLCIILSDLNKNRFFVNSASGVNPYKDIQKILTEDFNPNVPQVEQTVLPWKMKYSYKPKRILEFTDKSEFPLQEVCTCSLEELSEEESSSIFTPYT